MDYRNNLNVTYKSRLTSISVLTVLSAIGCMLLGYVFLPFAAGCYAVLLTVEGERRRLLSYIVPASLFVINAFLNGIFSLEAVAYVIIGFVIYHGFNTSKSKASVSFLTTALLVILMLMSAVLIAVEYIGSLSFSGIYEYYENLYEVCKKNFSTVLTSMETTDELGNVYQQINPGDATAMYNTVVISLIPISIITAFVLSGLSIKIFTSKIRKHNSDDIRLVGWKFLTTPLISYFYVICSVVSLIVTTGVAGISISFVTSVFMVVYFYMGVKAVYSFLSKRRGKLFAVLIIGAAIFMFPMFFPSIDWFFPYLISYIGVFSNNSIYKSENHTEISL